MRSIQISGESWMIFPLYEKLQYAVAFLYSENPENMELEYRFNNGATFEFIQQLTTQKMYIYLLYYNGQNELMDELIDIDEEIQQSYEPIGINHGKANDVEELRPLCFHCLLSHFKRISAALD